MSWWRRRSAQLAALWMAAIFAASSVPGGSVPAPPILGWDKLVHAAIYAVLAALLVRATGGRALLALAIAVLYGVTDELHQALVPGRFADPFDALADAIGALLGVATSRAFPSRAKEETAGDIRSCKGKPTGSSRSARSVLGIPERSRPPGERREPASPALELSRGPCRP